MSKPIDASEVCDWFRKSSRSVRSQCPAVGDCEKFAELLELDRALWASQAHGKKSDKNVATDKTSAEIVRAGRALAVAIERKIAWWQSPDSKYDPLVTEIMTTEARKLADDYQQQMESWTRSAVPALTCLKSQIENSLSASEAYLSQPLPKRKTADWHDYAVMYAVEAIKLWRKFGRTDLGLSDDGPLARFVLAATTRVTGRTDIKTSTVAKALKRTLSVRQALQRANGGQKPV